jgi:nitroreductase
VEGIDGYRHAIRTRRSIRDYEKRAVEGETIADILWGVAQAPTTPVSGPFLFHVIEGATHIAAIGEQVKHRPRASAPITLATPGSKIRLQGFSRCADGDRDFGPRGQFPTTQDCSRGTETSCFRHTAAGSAAAGSLPRCYDSAVRRHGRKSLSPRPSSPSQTLRSAASVPPSHSRERPEIVWA